MWYGTTASHQTWCSIGFTARNSSNTRYVYTAGHCSTGNGVNWGIGAQNIGPMSALAGLGRDRRRGHPGHELVVHR